MNGEKLKKIIIQSLIITSAIIAQPKFSDISSMAGAFSRLGFGARGMGMGNGISAVKDGNLVSYYNPALAVFQEGNSFHTSYSILSLDRNLNFVNFTRKFELGSVETTDGKVKPRSTAGISVGLINSGVSGIEARDVQGNKYNELSTSENQFFVSLSNNFSDKLAIGIAFKFFYYKLHEEATSSGLGFDVGAIYSYNDALSFSLVITDLNSKYEWDTGNLYGQNGMKTKNKFPLLKKLGAAYKFAEQRLIVAAEVESSNGKSNYLKAGVEYNIYDGFFIRSGFDKLNLSNSDIPVRPSFGFSYFYSLNSLMIGVDYAFVIEPYSSSDQHIIGININF